MTGTPIDQRLEEYTRQLAQLNPTSATAWGFHEYDHLLEDFSPAHHEANLELHQQLLADLAALPATGETDEITKATVADRVGLEVALHETGEKLRSLNNIDSPVQYLRDTFALQPAATPAEQEKLQERLRAIPAALQGYRESLTLAQSKGLLPTRRAVDDVITQCRQMPAALGHLPVPEAALKTAYAAFAELADWLEQSVETEGTDAVGRDRYELLSQLFVGAKVDLDEAYEWGQERLAQIVARQEEIASNLYGAGTTVAAAYQRLDADPRYTIVGVDALREWMQQTADEAIAKLGGSEFEIPEKVRTIEACIDPAGTGGIYYTPPSADFSRPGRMWWSVPEGQTEFHTWQELTTVYHEGVPGHHLQCAQAVAESERLNSWRRLVTWNSGHGEGWALYAEQLMAELGFHEDPATELGMLDGQRLRAARVVLDLGVHLGKPGWDYDRAWAFLQENCAMDGKVLRFELHRYLSWPGQAPSYALGQRLWEELRQDALAQGLSRKEFHAKALREGSIPMAILRQAVLS